MKYLIIGYGITGIAVESFLKKRNILYEIYDKDKNKATVTEKDILNNLLQFELGIKSPGVNPNSKEFQVLNHSCKKIISELDFAYKLLPKVTLIGVTGSNGKTSFGRFLSLFLNCKYKTCFAGNCGIPLISLLDKVKENDYVVVEVSNYMLNDAHDINFNYFFVTNITPNHLNSYNFCEEYYLDKLRVNFFSNKIFFVYPWKEYRPYKCLYNEDVKELISKQLNGEFNIKYALICYDFCKKIGIEDILLNNVIPLLRNEKYRLEVVYEDSKLTFVNDSKSTTCEASLGCYNSFHGRKRILILGGIHKSSSFKFLNIEDNDEVLIFGKDKNLIASQIKGRVFNNLEEIFIYIKEGITEKCYILFSPGCSSFDQYENFMMRGEHFNSLIQKYFIHK